MVYLKQYWSGNALDHLVEHLREGQVDELVFLPHVLAGAVVVEVERAALAAGVLELLHVIDVVGEDDLHVGEVAHPLGHPFQRNEAVVVDGGQRAHHLVDGKGAFAHQVEGTVVVGVAHVHVLDVGAQVLDGGRGAFAAHAVDVMDIPQGAQVVAGVAVHDAGQTRGAGEDAAGFDQQHHAVLLGVGDQLGERSVDGVLVVVLHDHAHHVHACRLRKVDEVLGVLDLLFACRDVDRGVEYGHGKALVAQGAGGCLGIVTVKRAALAGERGIGNGVMDLDAREIHFKGGAYQLVPGAVGPATGGKGKLH